MSPSLGLSVPSQDDEAQIVEIQEMQVLLSLANLLTTTTPGLSLFIPKRSLIKHVTYLIGTK